MPPEDEKKKQGVWGKYRSLIIVGVAVLVVVLIGIGIKVNSTAGDSITLTSLSNQLQTIQATLINQAVAIENIPTTDSVADVLELQNSITEIAAQLGSIEEELAILTGNIASMNMTGLATTVWENRLMLVAMNVTIWENHLMLVALCESLNITGVP